MLSSVVLCRSHSNHICSCTCSLSRLWDSSAPLSALTDSAFLHSACVCVSFPRVARVRRRLTLPLLSFHSISFGWTGYYLEKHLGGLRFLLVLAYLIVLAQVLRIAMTLTLAQTLALHVRIRFPFTINALSS